MSENLNNLYFDMTTGEFVLLNKLEGQSIYTRTFNQDIAQAIWIIPHNRGTYGVIAQVFDSNGEKLYPDKLKLINLNTIEITFGEPVSGKVIATFFDTES